MKDFFKLAENNTTRGREFTAGLTTFLAMAYILAVNPDILSAAGMPKGGVFFATAISTFIGTLLMAFLANYPFAMAPGMGLNAFFAYTVVIAMGYSWQFALLAVFVEGFIFLALTLVKVRETMFNVIPMPLKHAFSVGIGLFIAFIALQNSHLIVKNDATLISLTAFTKANIHNVGLCAILTVVGTLLIALFIVKKVPGAILLGILLTWFIGIICQLVGLYVPNPAVGCFSIYPTFTAHDLINPVKEFGTLFGALFHSETWTLRGSNLTGFALLKSPGFAIVTFTFMFDDIFNTMGTLIGVSTKANMLDKNGQLPHLKGALTSDAIGTSVGAVLGTSTVTTYVESAAGVTAGGRTGLTACWTAIFFLISLVFAPLFLAVPSFATAPALIIVGFYMLTGITNLKFDDYLDSIPAYLSILFMVFAYSISEGMCAGIITWTLLNICAGNFKKIHPFMYVLAVLAISKYVLL